MKPIIIAGVLLILPGQGAALTLAWQGGATNLTSTSAQTCTLYVRTSTDEHLPQDWTLSWVVESNSGSPLQIVGVEDSTSGLVPACDARDSLVSQEPWNDLTQVTFCGATGYGNEAEAAAYLVTVADSVRGKVRLIYAVMSGGALERPRSAEVTINGGCERSYVPTVLASRTTVDGDSLLTTVIGAGLAGVTSAAIDGPAGRLNATLVKNGDDLLSVRAEASLTGSETFALGTPDGLSVGEAISPEPVGALF
jgi:hypothetical protein